MKTSKQPSTKYAAEGYAVTTVICAASTLIAPQTQAQQAPAADSTSADLPTVVVEDAAISAYKPERVSSPKFKQPLKDVPQTVNVINEAVYKEQNATSLREVLRNTPGVSVQAGEGGGGQGGDNISIRGFKANNDIFIDGARDIASYSRDPFNLEQVEVYKGPSSTNSGRGTTGGSVNLVTKTPFLTPSYGTDFTVGSEDFFRTTIDINQPLYVTPGTPATPGVAGGKGAKEVQPVVGSPDTGIALRLNGMYQEHDVSNRDHVSGEKWGIGASLAFGLGTDTRLTLSYMHYEEENVPDYGIPWTAKDIVPYNTWYGNLERDFEDIAVDVGTIVFEHDFNDAFSVRNLTRYSRVTREHGTSSPRLTGRTINTNFHLRDMETTTFANQTDFNIEFNTGFLKHYVTTGFEVSLENSENRARSGDPVGSVDVTRPRPFQPWGGSIWYTGAVVEAEAVNFGAYVFDRIEIGEKFEINAGLRWDSVDMDYTDTNATGTTTNYNQTDDAFSWKAAAVYKPTKNGSIYFAYGTSFNPAVEEYVNTGTARMGFDTEPEENRSYELGTKWDVLDGRLSLSAALFRIEKTNAREQDGVTGEWLMAGDQYVQGVELGVAGAITNNWNIYAGYTYLDSRIEASLDTTTIGNEVAHAPDHSFNIWTTYDLPYNFQIGGGANFVGKRFSGSDNTNYADAYWTFDAMVAYNITENVSLRFNVQNLTDEDYADRLARGHFVPGAGRTYALTLSMKF